VRFARILAIIVAILLLFLFNTAPGHASTTPHPCAPLVPAHLPGSPGSPPATPGIIFINEILNNPASNWNCSEPAGTSSLATDSWVELYNPQNQPFNLSANHAGLNSGPNTSTFYFSFGSAIASHGYLVVFPDGPTDLLNPGNNLQFTIGGIEIDQVNIPALTSDASYARIPDGSTNWQITTNPTIDASNMSSTQVTATPVSTTVTGHSGSGYNGNGNTTPTLTPTLVSGKQPGWTKIQLPAITSATPIANSPLVTSPTISPTNNAWDVPRRVLLTVLVVALALSLFWCWKLFTTH
jgi:hypothetical protein